MFPHHNDFKLHELYETNADDQMVRNKTKGHIERVVLWPMNSPCFENEPKFPELCCSTGKFAFIRMCDSSLRSRKPIEFFYIL